MKHDTTLMPTPWVTEAGAAQYLGVHPRTIRQMLKDGRLTAHRLGGRIVRLNINEIDAALQAGA